MSAPPTFYQLFRRSRYSRPPDAVPGSAKNNQAEVFAVAALGFTLRHDPNFLLFFLRDVCRVPGIGSPEDYEIRCQDGHHADLVIIRPNHHVIVVEAKIGAPLEPHQNPTLTCFEYGQQIKDEFKNVHSRYYVVLAKEKSLIQQGDHESPDPLFLGFHEWGELIRMPAPSDLVRDFLVSLGLLGIPELNLQSFKHMKLEKETENTAKMLSILGGVAKQFKIPNRNNLWDFRFSADDGSFIGINIPRGGRFTGLSDCSDPSSKVIAWFGYEAPARGDSKLSIWFYPTDKTSLKRTRQFVQARFPNCQPASADLAFSISSPDDCPDDDVSWFQKHLSSLAD